VSRAWKPGDLAMVTQYGGAFPAVRVDGAGCKDLTHRRRTLGPHWHYLTAHAGATWTSNGDAAAHPLVVIDPEDRMQVERFTYLFLSHHWSGEGQTHTDAGQAALREFANPTPTEPTDPKACVTDRRENIWRLLADGDWVCTSGPDIGEYIVWWQLADDRGPLSVEVLS
jgi:hypothetical protein